jgi:dCMP deaminase|tara:strand:- start:10366 stop:10833 length:468 start_codon:yes stop_codon:yes gene_type:complete
MKNKFKVAFMDCAETFAQLSSAKRLQVGAIIVKDDRIISIGYNGMPSGWDNVCETEVKFGNTGYGRKLVSKPEVLHAEANAITKVAQSSDSSKGATIFCTHMPCIECAKLIHQSGISHVIYKNSYNAAKGCGEAFLEQSGCVVEKLEDQHESSTT